MSRACLSLTPGASQLEGSDNATFKPGGGHPHGTFALTLREDAAYNDARPRPCGRGRACSTRREDSGGRLNSYRHLEAPRCRNAHISRRSDAACAVTVSCTETAPRTAEQCSNAALSRAGGGSLSERAGPLTGVAVHRRLRLRRRQDFDAVFRSGRSWNNRLLVLRTLPNGLDHNRYGFITSKRIGNAVVRNRVRRRLREAVRVLPLRQPFDIVFSAKTTAGTADFGALKEAVVDLLARAAVLPGQSAPEGAQA